jgi:RNA-binding protein
LPDDLTGKQRRHLRALGHHLDPVVRVGHDGVSDAVVQQTEVQLEAHELIKVKVSENAPQERHEAAVLLAQKTHALVAQVLGRTVLLYRRRNDKPQIVLPK